MRYVGKKLRTWYACNVPIKNRDRVHQLCTYYIKLLNFIQWPCMTWGKRNKAYSDCRPPKMFYKLIETNVDKEKV